jgi:hypothetical protein
MVSSIREVVLGCDADVGTLPTQEGYLGAGVAAGVLGRSGLDRKVLMQVWSRAKTQPPVDKMSRGEFLVACKLVVEDGGKPIEPLVRKAATSAPTTPPLLPLPPLPPAPVPAPVPAPAPASAPAPVRAPSVKEQRAGWTTPGGEQVAASTKEARAGWTQPATAAGGQPQPEAYLDTMPAPEEDAYMMVAGQQPLASASQPPPQQGAAQRGMGSANAPQELVEQAQKARMFREQTQQLLDLNSAGAVRVTCVRLLPYHSQPATVSPASQHPRRLLPELLVCNFKGICRLPPPPPSSPTRFVAQSYHLPSFDCACNCNVPLPHHLFDRRQMQVKRSLGTFMQSKSVSELITDLCKVFRPFRLSVLRSSLEEVSDPAHPAVATKPARGSAPCGL